VPDSGELGAGIGQGDLQRGAHREDEEDGHDDRGDGRPDDLEAEVAARLGRLCLRAVTVSDDDDGEQYPHRQEDGAEDDDDLQGERADLLGAAAARAQHVRLVAGAGGQQKRRHGDAAQDQDAAGEASPGPAAEALVIPT